MTVQDELQAAIGHHQAGRLAEAEALYRQVLARAPRHPDALHFLGLLAQQTGNPALAVELIGQALERVPGHAPCHLHRGLALQSLGRLDEAEASYGQALTIEPNLAEAHNNLGFVRLERGETDRALPCLERALALRPEFPEAHLNRGNALLAAGRLDEAVASYARALALRPGHADTHNNLGQALEAQGRVREAISQYHQAQALQPDLPTPWWNEALARLRLGDFATGWRLYEWRFRAVGRHALVRDFRDPLWRGDAPLAGRTLFLHYEQGLGDTLQMLRYVPILASQGARVLVEVPPALATLAATLPGNPTVVPEGSPLPPFDLQCPLMSLPLAFGTTLATVPANVPYLAAPEPERSAWRDRLGPGTGRRIGLAWSGSTSHRHDRHRSLALRQLLPLLEMPAEFHSLQVEYRDGDRELLAADGRIRDHAAALRDFAATAGLIGQLDLVITVDSAVAHLAGALGKPVWVLLPFAADWRWLQERSDSPWYPTMRLFRQPVFGDWAPVLSAVATALLRE